MLRTFDGIPSHPLFVHLPIVLLPLATLGALALLVRPTWRARFAWPLAVVAAVCFAGIFLAMESGEEFDDILGRQAPIERHEELAETTRVFSLVFLLAAAAAAGADTFIRRRSPEAATSDDGDGAAAATALRTGTHVLVAATALFGVLASVWVMRTGHEGADIVWSGVVRDG